MIRIWIASPRNSPRGCVNGRSAGSMYASVVLDGWKINDQEIENLVCQHIICHEWIYVLTQSSIVPINEWEVHPPCSMLGKIIFKFRFFLSFLSILPIWKGIFISDEELFRQFSIMKQLKLTYESCSFPHRSHNTTGLS